MATTILFTYSMMGSEDTLTFVGSTEKLKRCSTHCMNNQHLRGHRNL